MLGDKIIIFGKCHPLSNKALLMEDFIAFDEYVGSVKPTMIAFTNAMSEDSITIQDINGGLISLHF